MNENDGIEIGEMSGEQEQVLSLKQIALTHIKKIGDMVSQELTPGFWEKKPFKVSNGIVMSESYKPDMRIGYCNAVDFLVDIIFPFSDKDFKDAINEGIYKESQEDYLDITKIDTRVRLRMLAFRGMNLMFERTSFFQSTEIGSEKSSS